MNFLIKLEFRNLWLCLTSLLFYFWDENWYIFILIFSILLNYASAIGIIYLRTKCDESRARWLFIGSVSCNLLLLIFYKYINLLGETMDLITFGIVHRMKHIPSFHLPLGISFFTFHGLSYIIDVYRNEVPVEFNPVTLALYFAFFPQLIAGPIVRYHDVAQQLSAIRPFNREAFAYGVVRFVIGLAKKMLIANTLASVADAIFNLSLSNLGTAHAWMGLTNYTLQIYFDFSGYSDMAIGLASIFGVRFPENFDYPYVSRSIREFWRRWHISLSSWFRDYLYISLGGNRVPNRRVYFNLITVFLLCGLWHGASWCFVIWGLYHGLFLVIERTLIFRKIVKCAPHVLQHLYSILAVSFGWVFFRATTMKHSIGFFRALLGLQLHQDPMSIPVKQYLDTKILVVISIAVLGSSGVMTGMFRMFRKTLDNHINEDSRLVAYSVFHVFRLLGLVTLFSLSIIAISGGLYNPFIYFRF